MGLRARDVASLRELRDEPIVEQWPFTVMLQEITSTAATSC
jgi:hypothetical protein